MLGIASIPTPLRFHFPINFTKYRLSLRPSNSPEKLFPRPEVQFSICDCDDFSAHDLTFHVGIRIILSGLVMGKAQTFSF